MHSNKISKILLNPHARQMVTRSNIRKNNNTRMITYAAAANQIREGIMKEFSQAENTNTNDTSLRTNDDGDRGQEEQLCNRNPVRNEFINQIKNNSHHSNVMAYSTSFASANDCENDFE